MNNTLKIINYLGKHREVQFTLHQLSKILKIPYASFYRSVQNMGDLLNIKTIGKSKVLTLSLNPIIKSYLCIASDEEKKEYLWYQPIIKKITAELNTTIVVVLFGSYAKGKQTEKSDIDLLIINKEGKKDLSFVKYELLFQKKINPIFVTETEFTTMVHQQEENVAKQALRDHIILNNPEKFWEMVVYGI